MPQPPTDEEEHPRFKDRAPDQYRHPELNPFVVEHREFGRPLLPADQMWPFRGRWHEAFGRTAPLHVEIGSGNGFYLSGVARRRPDWNLLGVEIRYKRTVLCARKIVNAGLSNALIGRYDAWYLDDLFLPGEVAGFHVHHPDPWPKARHEKNRLISRWFLESVSAFLAPGGFLRLKSDFADNVHRVPRLLDADGEGAPLPRLPLTVRAQSEDVLTGGPIWEDDVETNYQSKFRRRGEPVYAIELVREG